MSAEFKLNALEREAIIQTDKISLNGILAIPKQAKVVIVFAHGSGSFLKAALPQRNQHYPWGNASFCRAWYARAGCRFSTSLVYSAPDKLRRVTSSRTLLQM